MSKRKLRLTGAEQNVDIDVIEDESADDVHTMPAAAGHVDSMYCWCRPELVADYRDEDGRRQWLHREVH